MATHSSIPAWEIPWTEEPGGLQPKGSERVRHNWARMHTYIQINRLLFEVVLSLQNNWRESAENSQSAVPLSHSPRHQRPTLAWLRRWGNMDTWLHCSFKGVDKCTPVFTSAPQDRASQPRGPGLPLLALPYPGPATTHVSTCLVLPFPERHGAGIQQHVALSEWLLSPGDVLLRSSVSFLWLLAHFLLSLHNTVLSMYQFIHSPAEAHLQHTLWSP